MDTTAKNLLAFLEQAGETGRMKPETARTLIVASKKMLSIEPNWEQIDLSNLDVEGLIARFENLHGLKYKSKSLREYQLRFRRAINLYNEYISNPSGWQHRASQTSSSKKVLDKKTRRGKAVADQAPLVRDTLETSTVTLTAAGLQMMDYPFPLREACIVRLRLPADLKVSEVERLAAFMRSVAIDLTTRTE